jgi:hypothetical protein
MEIVMWILARLGEYVLFVTVGFLLVYIIFTIIAAIAGYQSPQEIEKENATHNRICGFLEEQRESMGAYTEDRKV